MIPRHFLIIDPYLLIYPEDEPTPLKQDVALHFVNNLWQLNQLINHPQYEVGISEACIAVIKHHPRSAFNSSFMRQICHISSRKLGDISKMLEQVIDNIRDGLPFKNAINRIETSKFIYDINRKSIVFDPMDYCNRLPYDTIRNEFLYMVGELTFAHKQHISPIDVFENLTLLTSYYPYMPAWAKTELKTYVYVTYLLDDSPEEAHVEARIPIESNLTKLLNTSSTRPYASLKEIIDYIQYKHRDIFLISKQLNDDIKKHPDKLRNSYDIESAIESLKIWLYFFESHLVDHSEKYASDYATFMYDTRAQFRISDASETVKRNPRLKNERKAQFNGKAYEAFLHVKLSQGTRIHFLPIQQEGKHAILLGKIGGHLPTARF